MKGQSNSSRAGATPNTSLLPGARVGIAILLAAALIPFSAVASTPRFMVEFRPVIESPRAGAKTTRNPITGERIALADTVLFSEADAESAWVESDPRRHGRFLVAISLRAVPSQRFREYPAAHVGGHIAILVAGRLQAAPEVREAIDGNRLGIAFNMSRAKADRLEARIERSISERR